MNFNLNDYEPVDSRIKKFWADHPDGAIITYDVSNDYDRTAGRWVFRADVYVGGERVTTGHAAEIDGQGNVNRTSVVENAETSAIGRALANFGYSGNKRASREEMAKVQSQQVYPKTASEDPRVDFVAQADEIVATGNLEALRAFYRDNRAFMTRQQQEQIEYLAEKLKAANTGQGVDGHAADTQTAQN